MDKQKLQGILAHKAWTMAKPTVLRIRDSIITGAKKAVSYFRQHKAGTVIVLLLLYILFWPKSPPQLQGPDPRLSSANPATTQPVTAATTQPITPQSGGGFSMYKPGDDGSDPQWSLPVELKADELQNLAKQVDKLSDDTQTLGNLEAQYDKDSAALFNQQIVSLFWSRLRGRGFRDPKLPLDWYQIVKEDNGLVQEGAQFAAALVTGLTEIAIQARLDSVRVRIIGGNVVVGDRLFVGTLQRYVDERLSFLNKELPLIQSVNARMQTEFHDELSKQQQ